MMSSGSGGPMPMMGGMQMPSLMGGQGMQMQKMGDMDDMMSKMMSKMGGMNMSSSSMGSNSMSSKTSFSSSSSSSFSSSSSSSMMSSDMSSMMGGMPPMRGMQMPGFDMPGLSFQEMPSMPAAPSTGAPEYTVTSPPMSPPPEMNHKVQKTDDYVPPTTQSAEATVLLKVKEGDEYKLALNMQQYSPEDITIKLNGNELTIEAAGHGEQFKQKHIIPDNIDLDAMSSSFSSDGVLVIKAPKK